MKENKKNNTKTAKDWHRKHHSRSDVHSVSG